tara:strand:- start:3914 stop:5215 length:1302 start_codon:yes stop_codon:yes gene_type:complete
MDTLHDTYKDTKVGRIPKDWKLTQIGDLGEYYGGLSGKTKDNFGSGKPYIPFMNIMANDIIDVNYFDLVEIEENENQNKAIKGDIFFNTSSETPEEVGMCSVLLDDISELYLNSFCFGFRLNKDAKERYLPEYISRFMNSGFGRKLMFPLAQGMTRYNLSKKYFVKLEIPFPPLPEQQKIAEILTTVDEQISTTDKIIEKSKELKIGLMQKLLSEGIGHTEFKDTKIGRIPKNWEYVRIEEHINLFYGNAFKSSDFNEEGIGTKLLRGVNITVGRLRWNKKIDRYLNLPYEDYAKYGAEEGDLVISMDGSLVGRNFARVNKSDLPLLIVQRVACIRAKKSLNLEYLKQLVGSRMFLNYVDAVKTNSGIPHISGKDIKHFKIPFPSLEEQKKIAEILSEADVKIEREQSQKAYLEKLKKGLMQELLTGKKRVKV